jgi:hypothetical protein
MFAVILSATHQATTHETPPQAEHIASSQVLTQAPHDLISRDLDWELEVLAYPLHFGDEDEYDPATGASPSSPRPPTPTPYSATEAVHNSHCQTDSGYWLRDNYEHAK